MTEAQYQRKLINKLEVMFPGCIIMKNDPSVNQGMPDLLILHRSKWAMLEVKLSEKAPRRPNQEHYVGTLNNMSYAAFISPDNEEVVLHDLQLAFGANR